MLSFNPAEYEAMFCHNANVPGYNHSYPFLSPECGINVVDGRYVEPLYLHIININHPTMAFVGIPFRTFLFPLFNQQVSFTFVTRLSLFRLKQFVKSSKTRMT
jgi:hypothetical protein